MYEEYMRQVSNDRINEARKMAAAHRQAKAARATGPNRASQMASKASGWLAAATQWMIHRPVFGDSAH